MTGLREMNGDDPTICRRVLLVRHGHYERSGDLGDTVWGLSPLGRRQAVRAGRRLRKVVDGCAGTFEGAYASPWPRATQTAEVAAREMELASVKVKPYLHELLALVDPDRLPTGMFPLGLETTGAEERSSVDRQVDRIRARFFKPPKRSTAVVVFTHGNVVRYLVTRTLGLPYEAWTAMDVAHTGISEIRIYPGGFEALFGFNGTGHLPPSMVTTA